MRLKENAELLPEDVAWSSDGFHRRQYSSQGYADSALPRGLAINSCRLLLFRLDKRGFIRLPPSRRKSRALSKRVPWDLDRAGLTSSAKEAVPLQLEVPEVDEDS